MTVKQLKTELDKYPDKMEVLVDIFGTASSDYEYEFVDEVEQKEIPFYDEDNDLEFMGNVIVITCKEHLSVPKEQLINPFNTPTP